MKAGRWEHVSLPAIAHVNDPIGRAKGAALWPEEFPVEDLLDTKRQIGPFLWSALYDGNPVWEGAKLFDEPARFSLRTFNIEGKRACIALDPAASKKAAADYSAIIVAAMEGFGLFTKMYILDVVRMQTTVPKVVRRALDIQRQRGLLVVVEAVGGFKAVPQYLREIEPALRVHEISPSTDKLQRALPVSAAWLDSRVLVPDDAPWVAEYLAEMTAFTGVNDQHDDQVDATAHAWNAMYRDGRPRGGRSRRVGSEWSPG